MSFDKKAAIRQLAEDIVSVADELENMNKFAAASVMDKVFKSLIVTAQQEGMAPGMDMGGMPGMPSFGDAIQQSVQKQMPQQTSQAPSPAGNGGEGAPSAGGDISADLEQLKTFVFDIKGSAIQGLALANKMALLQDPKGKEYADMINRIYEITNKATDKILTPEDSADVSEYASGDTSSKPVSDQQAMKMMDPNM